MLKIRCPTEYTGYLHHIISLGGRTTAQEVISSFSSLAQYFDGPLFPEGNGPFAPLTLKAGTTLSPHVFTGKDKTA